ncbi:pilus assembly FimT family protein [Oscillibacter sp.]|uniref:pilus assembly FimT family protein n=1 Tax=Oscillibacter sp. TaxID=1945593 RepID=UPI001B3FE86E|nr:prepilin-type N-terminal cleavage/methylation domain-containing protein [Oscillibacter sp.]MBP3510106.1 type II secretion system protein [Oscillibacter sp.]
MKRSRGGFSLTELLTVVAILAVLMAVAIPAVIAISRNLKMRELDDTAREIFLAAQNVLTARKADGTLSDSKGDSVEGQDGWRWLFDGDTEFLLPDGTVEPVVAENHIAILYHADSAMVLEVYYGEKSGSFASPGCEWATDDIQKGDYSNSRVQSRNAADMRAEKRIGYYDGDTDLGRDSVEQLLPPLLEIVNGNELTVKITVPHTLEYLRNGVTLTVVVEELDMTGAPTENSVEFSDTYFNVDGRYELVLDSLTDANKQFKKVCKDITPGANIRVTAKLSASPAADGTKYLSASAWKETNSLFAERTGDTVSVACARHLQNLEDDFSGFSSDGAVKAEQTENIDWAETSLTYQSIGNTYITSYSGNGLEIRGLNNGLFDFTAENMELTGIRIVNPVINRSGNVGALANTAKKAKINDCWVYAVDLNADGTSNFDTLGKGFTAISIGGTVGGLAGSATDCTITNSFSALSKVSGSTAGGFIGSASGCTITDCYATAENLSGTIQSAMFVGDMSGGRVDNCYAAGNIASAGETISGFANGSGTSFSGSYCAVSYNKEDGTVVLPVNGFAPSAGNCRYLDVGVTASNEAGKTSYDVLAADPASALSAAMTNPYRKELDGKAYPFPGLDMPHYGSWPMASQPEPGDGAYDEILGTKITEVVVKEGEEQKFYIYAGPDGRIDKIDIDKSNVFQKEGITINEVPDKKGWYQIVVTPKKSSGSNKDGWETNMSVPITINGENGKTVTVKLIFKAEGSV